MSNRNIILTVIAMIALVAIAGAIWFFTSSGSGEPSGETVAPTLDISASTQATPEPTAIEESAEAEPTATEEPAEATTAPATEVVVTPEEADAAGAGTLVVFVIDPASSSVRFTLDEDLSGVRTTVVGETNEVAGEIAVDFANPANSQMGEIVINARTLATDNDFRNRAIRGQILRSAEDAYEYITFTPTAIEGLPASVADGDEVVFSVTGDLTILETTLPVTFEMTVTAGTDLLAGVGTAMVNRNDWGLTIPSVPSVANVDEMVGLEITFSAAAKDA
jgi:polyisoprenoid-binding protein YceI